MTFVVIVGLFVVVVVCFFLTLVLFSLSCDFSVQEVCDSQRSQLMKVATLSLYDVPAVVKSAPSPGSLVFSECFLDSAIMISSGRPRMDGYIASYE